MKHSNVLAYIYETPWAVLPSVRDVIQSIANRYARGEKLTEDEIRVRLENPVWKSMQDDPPGLIESKKPGRPGAIVGDIAVMPLRGTIVPRADMFSDMSGGVSAEQFGQDFRDLVADSRIGAIIIDIDSPGGSVQGVTELTDAIYSARGIKPIYGVANHLAASAAYWIGSAVDELSVTPSGEVGSIGVYAVHDDYSKFNEMTGVSRTYISAGKFKVEGNPDQPLDETAKAAIETRVSDYYSMFTKAVARNRGVSQKEVENGFGEGRVVGATQALKLGMADRVDTLQGVIDRLAKRKPVATRNASAELDFRQRRARALIY